MQTLRNLQLPRKHLKCNELQPRSELSNQKEGFGKNGKKIGGFW